MLAKQSLLYVVPSQPQAGRKEFGQNWGRAVQVPLPEHEYRSNSQNSDDVQSPLSVHESIALWQGAFEAIVTPCDCAMHGFE
jgi:hypothetical protein